MIFIEVLKELYKEEKITLEKVKNFLEQEKITQEQYNYIVNE